jgi:hypothetical protein
MAKITCSKSTRALSQLTGPVALTVRTTDQVTCIVEYGEAFGMSLDMNALYHPLREALTRLTGWSAAVATRVGWHHLTAYLDWAGSAAWTAAIRGQTERVTLRDVVLDVAQGPAGQWLLGAVDLRGTWSASLGVDLVVLSGTTAVTLDGTPGLPGCIAPAVTLVGEAQVPLHGLARGSKWLERREPLSLSTFDASVALDLERVYLTVAGIFYGDTFTWQEFLEGWEALLHDAVFAVQIRTGTYTLARVSAAQVEEEERRYATQLQHYFWVQEEDYKSQGVWQAASGPHARGALP